MHYTYILTSKKNDFTYVGSTADLTRRLEEHNNGEVDPTRNHRPVHLEWYAGFKEKDKARDFEKYLKSSSGHAFRNKRLI